LSAVIPDLSGRRTEYLRWVAQDRDRSACSTRLCNSSTPASGLTTTCQSSGSSTASLVTGVTVTNIFVAKVVSDVTNTTDTGGTAAFDDYAIDWLHFENPYRGWGRDGSAFPDQTNTGPVMPVSGFDACRIWDWSVQAADTQLKECCPFPTGNDARGAHLVGRNLSRLRRYQGAVWNSTTCTTTFSKRGGNPG